MIIRDHLRNVLAPDDTNVESPTVFVVDPDPNTGEIVTNILKGYPFEVRAHSSGREFFAAYDGRIPGCLVAENRIADSSGLQIQRRLMDRKQRLPVIYVSAHVDVATAVVLMRGGAVHILEKPLRSVELFGAIHEAIELDKKLRLQEAEKKRLRTSIAALTQKERRLVSILATASSRKSIAEQLAICPRAVELRRRGVMAKLGLESSMELVRFALLAHDEIDGLLNEGEP